MCLSLIDAHVQKSGHKSASMMVHEEDKSPLQDKPNP